MTIWGTSQSCRRFLLVGKGLFVTLKISAPSQLASIALDLTFFSFTSSFASSALDLILSLSHYHLHVEILFSEPQELWCWFLTGKGCGTSLRLKIILWVFSYNYNKYLWWHWPHYEDGEPDEYEEGAADADHRECPEVDLTIACSTKNTFTAKIIIEIKS